MSRQAKPLVALHPRRSTNQLPPVIQRRSGATHPLGAPEQRIIQTDMVRTFPLSAGILEHKQRMGAAIWEYLWLLDHVTSDEPDGAGKFMGIVQFGNPISAELIARDLKESADTAKVNLRKLWSEGYVRRTRVVAAGYTYRVVNSKKWLWQRQNGQRLEDPSMEKPADEGRKPVDGGEETRRTLKRKF